MSPLIINIATARKYIRLPFINNTTYLADFVEAQKRYILPIVGKNLFTTIAAEALAGGEPGELLNCVYRAIAPLAYAIDLPAINTSISDNGVGQKATDNFTPAPRWAFLQLREMLFDKGSAGLEELLILLYENKPQGVTWEVPSVFDTAIKTGKEFNQYYTIYQPYRTFESLRPVVKVVQDEVIIPAIGEVFLQALVSKTSPSNDEKQAIILIKKCVAHLTIKMAAALLPVKIGADGWTVALDRTTDTTNQGGQQAPAIQLQVMSDAAENTGRSYLDMLITLLNKKASGVVFADFFNSELYKAPVTLPVAEPVFNQTSNTFVL